MTPLLHLRYFIVRSVMAVGLSAVGLAGDLHLATPHNGATIANNMPALGWKAANAAGIEVWIDGARVAVLPGHATRFVPFPLSFGKHEWKIIAVKASGRQESSEATFTVADDPLEKLPENALLLRHNWAVESSEIVGTNGARLSSPGVDTARWAKTSIPATVLTALVRHGVYPNPYIGLNNTLIPDANDAFNRKHDLLRFSHLPGKNPWKNPYWYRTGFVAPSRFNGKRVWLTFNEINYRAEVWLNGHRLAGPDQMMGMERTFRFDVTSRVRVGAENILAVATFPVDDPGEPAPPPVTPLADPGRNMGADINIAANYTKTDTIGWDWQPEVKDRDMGITEDVWLTATDDLEIADVYVGAELPGPALDHADLFLAIELANHSTAPQEGTLTATFTDAAGATFSVKEKFSLAPASGTEIELTPRTHAKLSLAQPKLWWPVGMGAPHLYTVRVEAQTKTKLKANRETHFGIRKVETDINPVTQSRQFRINDRPLFLQGGNWVMDMMLNATSSRYANEIALTKHGRLNFLRVWGPTGAPPKSFYDAADRAGILLQQDFLNDWWGTEHNSPGSQPPLDVMEAATIAIIKKYRNHPSLFLWCGGNEGANPRAELIRDRLLPRYDRFSPRHYLTASDGDGLKGGGPYHNLAPEKYFGHPKLTGFNSEIGPSGVPEWESLEQFLTFPPTNWAAGRFPLDGQWAYHDATDRPGENEHRKFTHLDDLVRQRYGAPATTDRDGVRAYGQSVQLLNYDTYRAVAEALNEQLWTKATGFALWKSHSSWPSVVWQLVDWYQQTHAGYYAWRRGCEPVHVQFNPNDRTVAVINRTDISRPGLTLSAELFDAAGKSLWQRRAPVVATTQTALLETLTVPPQPGLTFLKLRLSDSQGTLVSDNFYWLHPEQDFTGLAKLTGAKLSARVSYPSRRTGAVKLQLTNHGSAPALLVRLKLVERDSQVEVLPTFWSDNYVNLLPGETVELSATVAPAAFPKHPDLSISSFNPLAVVKK